MYFTSFSQRNDKIHYLQEGEIENYTNSILGTNDLLVNGRLYKRLNIQSEGHPYISGNQWKRGTIFIDGNVFSKQLIKYDIKNDKIVLNKLNNNFFISLELNNELIDSFYLEHLISKDKYYSNKFDDNYFAVHNLNKIIGDTLFNQAPFEKKLFIIWTDNSIYEKIYKGKYLLLRRYTKSIAFGNQNPLGRYSDDNSDLYLFDNNELIKINKKRTFLAFFSQNKTEVLKFLKIQKIKIKKADNKELVNLMKYCEKLTKNENDN